MLIRYARTPPIRAKIWSRSKAHWASLYPSRLTENGRSLPIDTTACAGQVECKRLVSTNTIDWLVAMQMTGQVHAFPDLCLLFCSGSCFALPSFGSNAVVKPTAGGDRSLAARPLLLSLASKSEAPRCRFKNLSVGHSCPDWRYSV
jgi:hypothetical protein